MKSSARNAEVELPAVWQLDSENRPKAMIRVGPEGQPFLYFLLEASDLAGFTEMTLVLAPHDAVTPAFVENWNRRPTGLRMRICIVVQSHPEGTGKAVLTAIEQDPIGDGGGFVVCNGDNLPSVQVLSKLRSGVEGQALIGYHADHLGLPSDRAKAFALIQSAQGWLQELIEKPNKSAWELWLKTQPNREVSMNLFRLDPILLLPALKALKPHAERNEFELPMAVQLMMDGDVRLKVLPVKEPILDLTRSMDLKNVAQDLVRKREDWTLEVCASSPEDVRVAAENGAHRVELCAHWECGGLTPVESDIRSAAQEGLPVHALIRPRAGHFTYSEAEWNQMHKQIESSLVAGASRVVVGGLNASGRFEMERVNRWVNEFGGHRLIIHRALDASVEWEQDAQALRSLGVLRVLSSGGEAKAWEGRERIQQLNEWGFDVTVASGVTPSRKLDWLALGIHDFHASCRKEESKSVRYFDGATFPVSPERVKQWFE
jgi:copper homeostasis protein